MSTMKCTYCGSSNHKREDCVKLKLHCVLSSILVIFIMSAGVNWKTQQEKFEDKAALLFKYNN